MRPVGHGRPGTEVIPADWATDHRPVLAGTRRGTLTVRADATTQTWDADTEQNVTVPVSPHFIGTCRVQALGNQARDRDVAGDRETLADYLITTEVTTGDEQPLEQQIATVTGTGDPLLDGQTLRILQVVRGTELFERYLFCTLDD